MTLAAYTITYVVLSTSGLLLLRRSLPNLTSSPGGFFSDLAHHPTVLAGGTLYALSFLTFLLALRRYHLSLVYPLFVGCGYMAVVLGAAFVLDERITLLRGVGIVIIGLGLILVLS